MYIHMYIYMNPYKYIHKFVLIPPTAKPFLEGRLVSPNGAEQRKTCRGTSPI